MSVNKQLNMQISNDEEILEPLRKLNLLDDFLFDVATVDLETCKIILELSLGIRINHRKCQKAHSGIVSSRQGLGQARTLARRLYQKALLARGTESRPQSARISRHPHGFLCRGRRRNRI